MSSSNGAKVAVANCRAREDRAPHQGSSGLVGRRLSRARLVPPAHVPVLQALYSSSMASSMAKSSRSTLGALGSVASSSNWRPNCGARGEAGQRVVMLRLALPAKLSCLLNGNRKAHALLQARAWAKSPTQPLNAHLQHVCVVLRHRLQHAVGQRQAHAHQRVALRRGKVHMAEMALNAGKYQTLACRQFAAP